MNTAIRRTLAASLILACGLGALAAARPAAAASCTSNDHVVLSAPLEDDTTGVSSWNYGYVQLWYSNVCETNWARVVSLVPGTSWIKADLIRSDYTEVYATSTAQTTLTSPSLYSPVDLDDAYGYVLANDTYYSAEAGQF